MAVKVPTYKVLGTDIALTRYSGTPSAVGLEFADSWGAVDVKVVPGGQGGLPQTGDIRDLAPVEGRENLGQALIMRLLTQKGALTPLGHPDYGCRLVELIGRLNNDVTRNLARLFTLEAIAQEARAAKLLDLAVETVPGQPDTIRIGFSVIPINDDQPLALGLEINL